jgi:hypothetical protein
MYVRPPTKLQVQEKTRESLSSNTMKAAKNKAIGYPNKDPSLPAFRPFLRGQRTLYHVSEGWW